MLPRARCERVEVAQSLRAHRLLQPLPVLHGPPHQRRKGHRHVAAMLLPALAVHEQTRGMLLPDLQALRPDFPHAKRASRNGHEPRKDLLEGRLPRQKKGNMLTEDELVETMGKERYRALKVWRDAAVLVHDINAHTTTFPPRRTARIRHLREKTQGCNPVADEGHPHLRENPNAFTPSERSERTP